MSQKNQTANLKEALVFHGKLEEIKLSISFLFGLHTEASYVYLGRVRPDWAKMSHFAVQGLFKACMLPYAFQNAVQGKWWVARIRDAHMIAQMAVQISCSRLCCAWAPACSM